MVGALDLKSRPDIKVVRQGAGKSGLIESVRVSEGCPAPKRRCKCIDICLRPAGMARGCREHLSRWMKDEQKPTPAVATPPLPKRPSITIPIPDGINAYRFWSKVVRSPGCWEWKAGKSPEGYGRFKIGGRLYSAHRVAYTLAKGPIPAGEGYHGMEVMHACDNPRCCKPDHLFLGTNRDNAKDMGAKGRNHLPRGERRAPISISLLTPGSQRPDWLRGGAWR